MEGRVGGGVTGARLVDGRSGGHRWGPDLSEMRWRPGNGDALVEASAGTWRSRLPKGMFQGGEPHTSLVSESSSCLIPGSEGAGRPSPPRPWGRGKEALSAEAEATQMRK